MNGWRFRDIYILRARGVSMLGIVLVFAVVGRALALTCLPGTYLDSTQTTVTVNYQEGLSRTSGQHGTSWGAPFPLTVVAGSIRGYSTGNWATTTVTVAAGSLCLG